jgi:protocatechuate 3,4-dioxygenase beta subunit
MFSTMTDASGRFAMTNIAPGSYRMVGERTGFVHTTYGSRGPSLPGPPLTLGPGQALKEIMFRLPPHAVIAGRVLDEDGEPLSNVQVQAMSPRYINGRRQLLPSSMGSTNDLGEYRIFGLTSGKYFVNAVYRSGGLSSSAVDRSANPAAAVPDEGYAPTFYPGATDASSAVPLEVASGKPVTNIDFTLRRVRTYRIRGKVRGPMDSRRSMVFLMEQNDTYMLNSRPVSNAQGPDGSFEIRGVTPGSYYVVGQQSDANGQYIGRVALNIGHSNVDDIQIVVSPAPSVTGQIRLEGDAQINPALVVVNLRAKEMNPFGNSGSALVNADGTFTVRNVSPNTYRVTAASRGGQQFYVKSVKAGEQDLPDGELVIGDGAAPAITLVLSTAMAQVSGQVTADGGSASQGATVVLMPSSPKLADMSRVATADQNGKFNLMSVPPGEYTMYAWDEVESGAWQDPEFLAKFENKGKKIVLKEKENVTIEAALLKVETAQ